MKTIDVRGLNCPEPVILVKRAMEKGEVDIEVISDANVAVENITRLSNKMGYNIEVKELNGEFILKIVKK